MTTYFQITEDSWNLLLEADEMIDTLTMLACAVAPKKEITLPAEGLTSTLCILRRQLQQARADAVFVSSAGNAVPM